ncbi:MAG TPA: MFS transporter [Bryobacteraceae bacterium]|nr:MFS transporter [Bryobacteraceae bacterium]
MTAPGSPSSEAATYSRITWRLMPYLFACYILAYVNRVNVGFAKIQMQQDLRMSDAVYGLGAGIFFIGYFFFEVPSNMALRKVGARRLLGPIMIVWGLVSAATMFATGATSYYILRFLLGAVESGFFPGVILYLTFWYTEKHRVRMVAIFSSAIPVSGVLAGPLCGWILKDLNGVAHLAGWQWLFLVTGIPSSIAGLATLFYLTDKPEQAHWLRQDEKELVLKRLHEESQTKKGKGGHSLMDAFRSPAVWWLGLVYFGVIAGNYGIGFWLPQVIKETLTKDPVAIGWLFVIPSVVTVIGMFFVGRHSDSTGERRWHFALSAIVAACAFAASAIPGIPGTVGFAALTLANTGVLCAFAVFWSLPTKILSGAAAAAGIAWINSVGNLAGYASPHAVGAIRDKTHSMTLALLALAAAMLISAVVSLYVTRRDGRRA